MLHHVRFKAIENLVKLNSKCFFNTHQRQKMALGFGHWIFAIQSLTSKSYNNSYVAVLIFLRKKLQLTEKYMLILKLHEKFLQKFQTFPT